MAEKQERKPARRSKLKQADIQGFVYEGEALPNGVRADATARRHERARMRPLVGTPVPEVTSTCSTSSTWLHDVPRI